MDDGLRVVSSMKYIARYSSMNYDVRPISSMKYTVRYSSMDDGVSCLQYEIY